jgi:beta-fructofuranosidase
MTVPRAHTIANVSARGYDLISKIHDISPVIDTELVYNSTLGNGSVLVDFSAVESGAIYFEVNITGLTSSTLRGTANFTLSSSISGEYIQGGINAAGSPGIWIDRGHVRGFDNPYFTDKFSEEGIFGPSNNGSWSMSLVYDRSILEIFLNGAQTAGTVTFFPTRPLDTLAVYVGGIAETASSTVAAWGLKDTWAEQANSNGTVVGNITQVEHARRR